MADEYTIQAEYLVRVTNLRSIAGSAHMPQSPEEMMASLQSAVSEMGRRVEVELDRIFLLMQNIDAAIVAGIANTVATGQAAADAGGLWEYDDDGELIPKEPT